MGCISARANWRRPLAPSVSAARATGTIPCATIAACRTDEGGSDAAAATASIISDSSAPWRSSPSSSRTRKSRSSSVARANSSERTRMRSLFEPAPAIEAMRASAASTSQSSSEGSAADAAGRASRNERVADAASSLPSLAGKIGDAGLDFRRRKLAEAGGEQRRSWRCGWLFRRLGATFRRARPVASSGHLTAGRTARRSARGGDAGDVAVVGIPDARGCADARARLRQRRRFEARAPSGNTCGADCERQGRRPGSSS